MPLTIEGQERADCCCRCARPRGRESAHGRRRRPSGIASGLENHRIGRDRPQRAHCWRQMRCLAALYVVGVCVNRIGTERTRSMHRPTGRVSRRGLIDCRIRRRSAGAGAAIQDSAGLPTPVAVIEDAPRSWPRTSEFHRSSANKFSCRGLP
jgi:hypothetical protein